MVDNDQINEKNVCLVIKGGKLSAETLAKAMKLFITCAKKATTPKNYMGKGKQTVKQLIGQGYRVKSVEISDKNIKDFESIARKYGVDFAVVKDDTETPPKHLVFFKARDSDAISAAFKEYSAKIMDKSNEKPLLSDKFREQMEKVQAQILHIDKDKKREVAL